MKSELSQPCEHAEDIGLNKGRLDASMPINKINDTVLGHALYRIVEFLNKYEFSGDCT